MHDEAALEAEFADITGLQWICMRCNIRKQRLRVFSMAAIRGDLYISEVPQPGVDRNNLNFLCNDCWPHALMWKAQQGYDIHTHSVDYQCDEQCFTFKGGRRGQYWSLATIDRRSAFQLVKFIDGQPRVNGSPLIFAFRAGYFYGGSYSRQTFYESIDQPTEVSRQLLVNTERRWSDYPIPSLDSHLMILEWYESAYNAPNGVISEPRRDEKSIGYHCVSVDRYDEDTSTFHFWNSWGAGWGNHSHGSVSLDYVQRHHYETMVLRHARWGPSPDKAGRFQAANEDVKKLKRIWSAENPRYVDKIRGNGRNLRLERYETVSPTTGRPVVCIELKTGFGLRIAWLFLVHSDSAHSYSDITELYVWPIYRRLHIGSFLETEAVAEAQNHGSTEIRLMMNEADAIIGPMRAAARNFLKARGYSIWWRQTVQPRAVATGTKRLEDQEP
jgi:GNAT superfamily N-acetyltransferase